MTLVLACLLSYQIKTTSICKQFRLLNNAWNLFKESYQLSNYVKDNIQKLGKSSALQHNNTALFIYKIVC